MKLKILTRPRHRRHSARRASGPSIFWPRFRYFSLLAFLAVCLLGGGAARADVLSLLYLRPAAILCLAGLLLSPGAWEFRRYRVLFILLGLLAATMVVQLIPLPPDLWLSLPGHAQFAEAAAAGGFDQPWRPISLAPDLTLNSLLALLPCLVILVGFAGIQEDQRRSLLLVLIAFVCLDAVWSIFQAAGGPDSATYLYRITNNDSPVGFFSNRNHHALLMALGFPMLALWASKPTHDSQRYRVRLMVALAIGLFLIPMILVTGSRAGLVLGAISLGISFLLAPNPIAHIPDRWRPIARIAGILVPIILVGITIFANRALSLDRLTGVGGAAQEQRVAALPALMEMLRTLGPQGVGYGAFDPAFRIYEPDRALQAFYFNHAHNDLIELVLTGGWVALLVLVLFLFWFGRRAFLSLRGGRKALRTMGHARLGAIMVALVLGASLTDYPLRTPVVAVVFTIACAWLALDPRAAEKDGAVAEPAPGGAAVGRRPRWAARIAIALPLVIALGWIAMGVTASATIGRLRPSLTLGWWPFDSGVNAAAASGVIQDREAGAAERATAETQAKASLRREPVNTDATRTLALLAAMGGDQARAQRLMVYSEYLSRRDLTTELWFIENRVQANDIRGALVHYDRALRTGPQSGTLLFPVLIQASDNRDILVPLTEVIARRPPWWRDFVTRLIAEGRSPAAIETIVTAARLNSSDVIEHGLQIGTIGRLIELGSFDRALRLYDRSGPERSGALVHNGDFERENRLPPIDWTLADSGNLAGILQTDPSGRGGRTLLLVAQNGTSGEVARQLVMLRPGHYRLSASAGDVSEASDSQPQIILTCAGAGAPVFQLRLPPSPSGGRNVSSDFTVGNTGCPAQWLTVNANSPSDVESTNPWIDRVAITKLDGH